MIRMTLLTNTGPMRAAIERFGVEAPRALGAAYYLSATNIMSTSLKMVPVATGWLRKSRYITEPDFVARESMQFTMGYSAPYALFVHEINKRYVVGEWKFLSKAVDWHAPRLTSDIARWVSSFLAHGVPPFSPHHPTGPQVGPVPPRLGRRRRKGETKRERRARIRANAKLRAKREQGAADNRARMIREAEAYAEAVAAGRRPPRPGRGG